VRSLHTQTLLSFIDNEHFELTSRMPVSQNVHFTYESKANHSRSMIDHFMMSLNMCPLVSAVHCDDSVDNLSDHNVLSLTLNMNVLNLSVREVTRTDAVMWDEASCNDIRLYQECLDCALTAIHVPVALSCTDVECSSHNDDITLFHDAIIDACLSAADVALPKRRQKRVTPGWNEFVRPFREQAMLWHSIWKSNGSPHTGVIADIRRQSRARYHQALRRVRKHEESLRSLRMAESFHAPNKRDFWREIKKVKGGRVNCATSIDGATGEENIVDVFSAKYKALYRSVPYDPIEMNELSRELSAAIPNHVNDDCHSISPLDVRYAIGKLKSSKSDGNKGMLTNHLIHGTSRLRVCMALLFNAMVKHACIPSDFSISTLIPIPKHRKKSLNVSDNYRAIALSSILGKVLDHILLVNCSSSFTTSDHQFGFKPHHSTSMCTFAVNETINHYVHGGSDVYCTLLDASRAFDRVQYVMLFRSLISKGICPVVCRFLVCFYTSQCIRVKWCNTLSQSCSILNGVKQGGVMSPILFSVYIDGLLCRLRDHGVGCRAEHVFLGAFAYADDLILLAPTLHATKSMLRVCEQYANEFNILFNATKSKLIIRSKNVISCSDFKPVVSFMNGNIEVVQSDKHLGNIIGNVNQADIVQNIVNDLKTKTNMVKFQFKNLPPHVMYSLFKTHCMPLYGSQLLDLSDFRAIDRLYVAWRKAIRYILRLPSRTHSRLLHLICHDHPVEHQMYCRFVRALCTSSNKIVIKCCEMIRNGSNSPVSNSLSHVAHYFHTNRMNLHNIDVKTFEPEHSDFDSSISIAINDLLNMRNSTFLNQPSFFSFDECCELLHELCVN